MESKSVHSHKKNITPQILIAICAVLVGAVGLWLTFGIKAAPPTPSPKIGLVDDGPYASRNLSERISKVRDYITDGSSKDYSFAITQGGIRHTVLNVGIRELVRVENDGTTTYIRDSIESRIANAVAWNKRHPRQKLTVHLRFHVGEFAPNKWKELCGTVHMVDPRFGVDADAPRWWAKDARGNIVYKKLYTNAMKALAGAVSSINNSTDTLNIIGSVNAPGAAPNYPEPMIIYASSDKVRSSLLSRGFTQAAHNEFMTWFPTQAVYFKKVAVEIALNPYQNIDSVSRTATQRDRLKYRDVANALIRTVGNRTVLANYSAREAYSLSSAANDYTEMYDWMASKTRGTPKVWAGVQMARPHRVAMGNPDINEAWDKVAIWAANKGFSFAETTGPKAAKEPPFGTANYWPQAYHNDSNDISQMKSINNKFLSNPRPY